MMLENSEQFTRNIYFAGKDGRREHAVVATCTMRPGRYVSISVEVVDGDVYDAHADEATRELEAFMLEAQARAMVDGLPLYVAADTEDTAAADE